MYYDNPARRDSVDPAGRFTNPKIMTNARLPTIFPRPLSAAVLLAAIWLTACAASPTRGNAVREYRLDNGLRLVVKRDSRAPVVASQVWYRVGSSYEYDGVTGISHALEHMMFKGTPNYPGNEFSRIVSRNGGRENAFTSLDYTAYHQLLERSRLEISFRLEADRMANLLLHEEEFEKEIEVIKEERRLRVEDVPQSYAYEAAMAAAFQASPYRHPIVGWMSDLERMETADLRVWYRDWYAPNNATVVVVGDVEAQDVFELAREHFGPLPASPHIPAARAAVETRPPGLRRIRVKRPAELPYLVMVYTVPSLASVYRTDEATPEWEPYALTVLEGVLSGGGSGRLPERLVRGREVAAGASAGYRGLARLEETTFVFSATPARGRGIDELERALGEEIALLREERIDENELQRVKAQVIADDVYERDSVFYQAMLIGMVESLELPREILDEYVERIGAVTAAQVRAAARKYLVEDALTVAELVPLPIEADARPPRLPTTSDRVH